MTEIFPTVSDAVVDAVFINIYRNCKIFCRMSN